VSETPGFDFTLAADLISGEQTVPLLLQEVLK